MLKQSFTPEQRSALTSNAATLGIRPESLHLAKEGEDGIAATIDTGRRRTLASLW